MSNSEMYNIKNIVIYGEEIQIFDPYFVFIEKLEWDKAKHNGFVLPHLHSNLYQIIIMQSGTIELLYNDNTVRLNERSLVLIPEYCVHSFKFIAQTTGWSLSFSQLIFEKLMEHIPSLLSLTDKIVHLNNQADSAQFQFLLQLCKILHSEVQSNTKESILMKSSLIDSVLILTERLIKESFKEKRYQPDESIELQYVYKFKRSLRSKISMSKKLIDYALELNISPTHLNRVCKKVTGDSASKVMQETVIMESKKLLLYTNLNISEIAFKLHFKSTSHFSKYFKKYAGINPKKFKKDKVKV